MICVSLKKFIFSIYPPTDLFYLISSVADHAFQSGLLGDSFLHLQGSADSLSFSLVVGLTTKLQCTPIRCWQRMSSSFFGHNCVTDFRSLLAPLVLQAEHSEDTSAKAHPNVQI